MQKIDDRDLVRLFTRAAWTTFAALWINSLPPFPFDRQRANAPSWKATTIFSHQGGPEPPQPPNRPEAEGGRVRDGHPLLLLLADGLALEWGKGTNFIVGMQMRYLTPSWLPPMFLLIMMICHLYLMISRVPLLNIRRRKGDLGLFFKQ